MIWKVLFHGLQLKFFGRRALFYLTSVSKFTHMKHPLDFLIIIFFSSYLVEVEVGDWVWGLKIPPKDIHLLLWIHM